MSEKSERVCPFCGSKDVEWVQSEFEKDPNSYGVLKCSNCDAKTTWTRTQEQAEIAWKFGFIYFRGEKQSYREMSNQTKLLKTLKDIANKLNKE